MADETLKLILEVDTASGQASVHQFTDEYKKSVEEWTDGPRDAAAANRGLISSFTDMYFAGKVVFDAVREGVKILWGWAEAADESQRATDRMGFSFKAAGYDFQALSPMVEEFANSFKKVDDDVVKGALKTMMQYTQEASQGMDGVKLAMDMTSQTGMDLESTIRVVGMAMNGNAEAAGRWIPELRDINAKLGEHATNAEKSAYALGVLKDKFGGALEATNSLKDKLSVMNKEWGDVAKSIGNVFLPVAKLAVDTLGEMGARLNISKEYLPYLASIAWQGKAAWDKAFLDAEKSAFEEWMRQRRQLKEDADRKARAQEYANLGKHYTEQYKLDQQFEMKLLQLKGDELGQIEMMRRDDVEKARQANLDIYQIEIFYADMRAKKELEIEQKRLADLQNSVDQRVQIWEQYYGKVEARQNAGIDAMNKLGIATTASMQKDFNQITKQWGDILSGPFTKGEIDQAEIALKEWAGTLKDTLGWDQAGGMLDATMKNIERMRREFDVMTGTGYSVQFDDTAVIQTVNELKNVQDWLRSITERRWEVKLQVNSDSIRQIDQALADLKADRINGTGVLVVE